MYMLTSCKLFHTKFFCARNQFLFCIKRLSKFLYRCFEIWAFHSLKQWLVIKHTVVSIYTKHKFIVISERNAKYRNITTRANPTFSFTLIIRALWLTQSCVGKTICGCEVTIFCGARTIYALNISKMLSFSIASCSNGAEIHSMELLYFREKTNWFSKEVRPLKP